MVMYEGYAEDFEQFENLVNVEGFLVPIAQIKAVGWVELSEPVRDPDGIEHEQFFFRVYLNQPVSNAPDNATRDLAAFYETQEEAETERLHLARKIDEFYSFMQKAMAFGNGIH